MYEIKERPLHSHQTFTGSGFESATEITGEFKAWAMKAPWTNCYITGSKDPHGLPIISLDEAVELSLGEIGLAYLIYRFRDMFDANAARRYYRTGQLDLLRVLLKNAYDKLKLIVGLRPQYVFTGLEGELMGVLTEYTSVSNKGIVEEIERAELDKRVSRWLWRPTEFRVHIKGGLVKRMFHYGVQIMNGETGHRALAFRSSLWSQSINGLTYEFGLPIVEKGYARHMPTKSLTTTLAYMKDSLEENKLAEAFEQSAELPGTWGARRFDKNLPFIKARDTTKEKLSVVFSDNISIYKPETALDVIYQLLDAGAEINITAARAAQEVVGLMISEIMSLPVAVGGEVIADD